jgi:protease IV
MKNFFGSFLGALVGVIITGILCTFIFAAVVVSGFKSAFSFSEERDAHIKPNSVLIMKFTQPIRERDSHSPFAGFDFGGFDKKGTIGLDEIIKSLKRAATDSSIKGVYLDLNTEIDASAATIEEIRNALLGFRKDSKKFVYAYSEALSQKSYYLATAADKIMLHPEGDMMFKGLTAQVMYYKNALEKLNVDMQVFRHGKFKSAVEPFLLDKMSPANRLQLETLLNGIWGHMLEGISKQRGVTPGELQKIADELLISDPAEARKLKLVDELRYKDEVLEMIRQKLSLGQKEKINFVSISKYAGAGKKRKWDMGDDEDDKGEEKSGGKDKLAVIYCVGGIESGKGDEETIGSETIAKAIKDARTDSSVKAIVLRVNSPGGSALASDVIWREVVLAKKAKPVVVSMGDVAASGGYYISCAADRIFAQPNTITGSIGVFGLMPNAQRLFTEKLGIYIDTANTARHSDMGTPYRGVTAVEGEFIQKSVEKVYDTFTKRVAEGRGMSQADVDSIGQGRVWSGIDALRIKLVDELGGINDAIAFAAKRANLKDDKYELLSLPRQKDPLKTLLEGKKDEEETIMLKKHLGIFYEHLKAAQAIGRMRGVQARLPFEMVIE